MFFEERFRETFLARARVQSVHNLHFNYSSTKVHAPTLAKLVSFFIWFYRWLGRKLGEILSDYLLVVRKLCEILCDYHSMVRKSVKSSVITVGW